MIEPYFRNRFKESFTEGAQILLLGAMVIGIITGGSGKTIMDPFTGMIFKGMLAFFLLDMGVATAKRLTDLRNVPKRLAFYGVLAPITHASIALLLSWAGGLSVANATLLAVLEPADTGAGTTGQAMHTSKHAGVRMKHRTPATATSRRISSASAA